MTFSLDKLGLRCLLGIHIEWTSGGILLTEEEYEAHGPTVKPEPGPRSVTASADCLVHKP